MPVPTSQTKKHETAIAQNKQSLREAEEARLVSSWLKASLNSPTTTNQSKPSVNNTNQEQIEDDESDFSDNEEGDSGLGFTAPKTTGNNILDRQHLSANDKLRRQMLGKNAFKSNMSASKPLPPQLRKVQENDSEDETEGRTKVAGKKSKATARAQVQTTATINEDTTNATDVDETNLSSVNIATTTTTTAPSKKRPASYLDEMLAKRSAKRNRAPPQPQARKAKKSDREED